MLIHRSLAARFALGALAASAAFTAGARDARACGGCFHEPTPSQTVGTLITDHRMVLSISTAQTVLWDQIRYSGSAAGFAWVLPVKPGARIELSQDAWIASLDAATQTVIQGPATNCGGPPPDQYVGSGGGCGGSSESATGFSAPGAASDVDAGSVQVISQQVVGPYDAVTVRSTQGEALGDWLRVNGYEVPQGLQPTIDAFTSEGFDFIALKLAPGEGVQAMQPVRVVSPGANLSLPLRMVAAGVGATVGIELFVLSEGRYQTQNFPGVSVDFSKLAWDPTGGVSNYTLLENTALALSGGRGWLTTSAGAANLGFTTNGVNPPLDTTYQSTCVPQSLVPMCDAGTSSGDAASTGSDAGAGSMCAATTVPCDDLELAMTGIGAGTLYITRLRSLMPAAALADDLMLEASPVQQPVPSFHQTSQYTIPNYNPCPNGAKGGSTRSSSACATSPERPGTRYEDAIVFCVVMVGLGLGGRRARRLRARRLD